MEIHFFIANAIDPSVIWSFIWVKKLFVFSFLKFRICKKDKIVNA